VEGLVEERSPLVDPKNDEEGLEEEKFPLVNSKIRNRVSCLI
jgi:hypothetical protein